MISIIWRELITPGTPSLAGGLHLPMICPACAVQRGIYEYPPPWKGVCQVQEQRVPLAVEAAHDYEIQNEKKHLPSVHNSKLDQSTLLAAL